MLQGINVSDNITDENLKNCQVSKKKTVQQTDKYKNKHKYKLGDK